MIIVTGGAGFIGSNIVQGLNARGVTDILVVDDLSDGRKCLNLSDAHIHDYLDKDNFLARLQAGESFGPVEAVFHQGACSATTEWDGRFVMNVNYAYTKAVLRWCVERKVPFYYASSASVYGEGPVFKEDRAHEHPLNAYAYSKFQFDCHLRPQLAGIRSPVVGLRYFNVYGPREQHKGSMASVAFHLNTQVKKGENPKLFEGCDGFPNGGQMRDFIYVDDVCKVNLWFWQNPQHSGIFNCGTGRAEPFQNVAEAVIKHHQQGAIQTTGFRLVGTRLHHVMADASQDRLPLRRLEWRLSRGRAGRPWPGFRRQRQASRRSEPARTCG